MTKLKENLHDSTTLIRPIQVLRKSTVIQIISLDHFSFLHHTAVRMSCVSLLTGYWHQVRSYGSKNMAVSVLFSRLTEFDPAGCENAKLEYTPLSDVNMVWTYPGHGPQTMGNVDPFEMKYVLLTCWCRSFDPLKVITHDIQSYFPAK